MAMLGMDTDGMKAVLPQLQKYVETFNTEVGQIKTAIDGVTWQGQDKGKYLGEFDADVTAVRSLLTEKMNKLHQELNNQITKQEEVSAA